MERGGVSEIPETEQDTRHEKDIVQHEILKIISNGHFLHIREKVGIKNCVIWLLN